MEVVNERAILVEINNGGDFKRIALSEKEFDKCMTEFNCQVRSNDLSEEISIVICAEDTIFYCRSAMINSDAWVKFFTNMQYGLPEEAIAEGKYSEVAINEMGRMRGYITEEGSRLLFAWRIAKGYGMDYKECFTEEGPSVMLDVISKTLRSFVDHELGFDKKENNK